MDREILKELAIIILNYKDYSMTIDCVNNLKSFNSYSKIIVVDNNSPNDSYDKLLKHLSQKENVYVIKTEKNGGYSYGNNEGIRYVNRNFHNIKYICIMNPDVFLNNELILTKICHKLNKNSNIAGMTGISLLNGNLVYKTLGWKTNTIKSLALSNFSLITRFTKYINSYEGIEICDSDNEIGYIEVMPGSFFIMKNSIFKEFDYLDEGVFLYFEEDILAQKIKSTGLKASILISESYIHKHQKKDKELNKLSKKKDDFKIYMESQQYYAKNYIKTSWKYMWILKLTQYIHLYIEIPLISLMYIVLEWFKKDRI
jgi:hypothetical protein